MRSTWRWAIAFFVTFAVFVAVTWLVIRFFPHYSWLSGQDDLFAFGVGAGAAVAVLAAAWGQVFATAKATDEEPDSGEIPVMTTQALAITGDNEGIVSTGNHALNVQGARPRTVPERPPVWPARTPRVNDGDRSEVKIEGGSRGIVSMGDEATNIQELNIFPASAASMRPALITEG
jgi:hypothetical protein